MGILTLLLGINGSVSLIQGIPLVQEVYGVTLPAGASQVGTINGAPVIKSPTNDMSSDTFKEIVSGLMEGQTIPPYVVNQVSWTGNSNLVGGQNISSFGQSPTAVFGADGYNPTDKAVKTTVGGQAIIKNVGSALNITTGETIPLNLGITIQNATAPGGGALTDILMAAKSQNGVITLAFGSPTHVGTGGGGQTEGGPELGGTTDGTGFWFIESIGYTVTLINSNTGQPLPNSTLMPIKMSDIDASQRATMGGEGAKGYIIAPDSVLAQAGNGFQAAPGGAINYDTTKLSSNSYVVLKEYNSNGLQYTYTDGANNHLDIVTGIFGNTPWDLPDLLGGYIEIDKSTLQYGKDEWNDLYGFKDISFEVVDDKGTVVATIKLDKDGKGTSERIPAGEYTLRETSNKWSSTGQTIRPNEKITVKSGETTKAKLENMAVTGQIKVKKKGKESGTDLWNQLYTLKGNIFKLTSLTDGKTYEITTDENGEAISGKIPLGKYTVEEIKASNGFVNTFKKATVELTYKDNKTEVVFDETTGENTEIKGQNKLEKEDVETGKETQGKAEMATAEYGLYYADDATGSSPHKKGDPVKWSDIPITKLLAGEKVTSSVINGTKVDHGDNIVISVDDKELNVAVGNLALGKYEWRELNAPEGYALDKGVHSFEISKKDDQTQTIITKDTHSKEQVIKAKITLQKLAEILGESAESGYNGVEFTITPLKGTKGEPITIKTGINNNDEDGFAEALLSYGDYVIKESKGIPGFDKIRDIYIHMETDTEKDLLTLTASNNKDFSNPFSKRVFSLSDNLTTKNPNAEDAVGTVSSDKPTISLSKMTFTDKVTPDLETDPKKDVTKTDGGDSINHGNVALSSDFVYVLESSSLTNGRNKDATDWSIVDDYDENYDQFNGTFKAYALTNFGDYKKGDALPETFFTAEDNEGKVNFAATKAFLDVINANKGDTVHFEIRADFYRHTNADIVYNSFTEIKNGVSEKSNEVDTKTPAPEPHKFDVEGEKVDLEGNKLLNDDKEMNDRYQDSNEDPYVDKVDNNEKFNFNTKVVKPGDRITYQLWLDTRPYDETSELTTLQMVDDFDESLLDVSEENVHVYDKAGKDQTKHFKIDLSEGILMITANEFVESLNSKGEKVEVVDTQKIPFNQIYKIEFVTTVKENAVSSQDIVNTAKQLTIDNNGKQLDQITEKRVNPVENEPIKDVQKEDQGESINGNRVALSSDFVYVLNSRGLAPNRKEDVTTWVFDDDYQETHDRFDGTFRVYAAADFGEYTKGTQLPEEFFKAEEKDGHVLFTAQDEFLKIINELKDQRIVITIHADFFRFGDSKEVVNTFEETINDQTEKSNEVHTNTQAPEPHKFDLSEAKVDLKGQSLLDDDKEMADRYKDSNKDPYKDKTDNNEKTNINTKTVKLGDTITYQLWLDTTPFDQTSELKSLQMVDDYDEKSVTPKLKEIHVYDSEGNEVTKHFRIEDQKGKIVIAANVFKETVNSKGETVEVIDTEILPLGQVYKIDVPMTVKNDVKSGTDILNTAVQEWTDSDDEKSDHVTEKRVNKVEIIQEKKATKKEIPQTGSYNAFEEFFQFFRFNK